MEATPNSVPPPPLDRNSDADAGARLVQWLLEQVERRTEAAVARALARHQPIETPRRPTTLSVNEAAAELGAHPRTVRRMIGDGRLKATRTGTGGSARVRVTRASVDALLGADR